MAKAEENGDAFNAAVVAQLKARREFLGMTYPEITAATGLSKQTVMPVLLNRIPIKFKDLPPLAKALGLDPLEVWREADRIVSE